MKIEKVIKVVADNYIEEQLILKEFPDAFWVKFSKAIFFIPIENLNDVEKLKNEMEKK